MKQPTKDASIEERIKHLEEIEAQREKEADDAAKGYCGLVVILFVVMLISLMIAVFS